MKQCPKCRNLYADTHSRCDYDGASLVDVNDLEQYLGLIINKRYRLERPLPIADPTQPANRSQLSSRFLPGSNQIFQAIDWQTNTVCAIKILGSEFFYSANADYSTNKVEAFVNRAGQLLKFRHANAVSLIDIGFIEERLPAYLVMELLTGNSLDRLLYLQKRLAVAQALALIIPVCDAVEAAHAQGLLHRGLKPSNIFIVTDENGNEQVKVLDFDIANISFGNLRFEVDRGIHELSPIYGLPEYFSPEFSEGLKVDARSDVYTLGIILYQMLIGQPPFVSEQPIKTAFMHIKEPPPAMAGLYPDISQQLESVVMKALAKRPQDRYQSAQQFAAALKAVKKD